MSNIISNGESLASVRTKLNTISREAGLTSAAAQSTVSKMSELAPTYHCLEVPYAPGHYVATYAEYPFGNGVMPLTYSFMVVESNVDTSVVSGSNMGFALVAVQPSENRIQFFDFTRTNGSTVAVTSISKVGEVEIS